MTNLNVAITSQAAQLTTLAAQVGALQGSAAGQATQLSTLSGQIATLQGSVAGQATQITTLSGQVGTLQGSVAGQTTQLNTLTGQVATLQGQVAVGSSDAYVAGSGYNVSSSGDDGGLIRHVGVGGLNIRTLTLPAGNYFLVATLSLYNADFDGQQAACELLANGTRLLEVDAILDAVTDWGPSMSEKVSLPNGGTVTVRCGGFNLYARPSSRLAALKVDKLFIFP